MSKYAVPRDKQPEDIKIDQEYPKILSDLNHLDYQMPTELFDHVLACQRSEALDHTQSNGDDSIDIYNSNLVRSIRERHANMSNIADYEENSETSLLRVIY
jgi:hypothetical protein